jgi:ubiquinone/menaquinone biosynthesis C-methylase UbiE
MNKEDFFNNWAPSYDWLFPSVFYQAVHQRLLEYVKLPDQANVLDIGCGTGKLLNYLASEFTDLRGTGLDFSPGMLTQARQSRNHRPRLIFVQGNAESLPFAESQFDAVFNTISFLHYQHPEQVLSEVKRVLRVGGRFYLVDSSWKYQQEPINISFSPQGIKFYSPELREKMGTSVGLKCVGHHFLICPVLLTIFEKS